jgi:hypothetical protein
MPDGKTHKVVSTAMGTAFAICRASGQTGWGWLIEAGGGAAGGCVGGRLPDVLEPANSPWHRGAAHSYATGGLIISLGNAMSVWEAACRKNAERCGAVPMVSRGGYYVPAEVGPLAQFLSVICELFWRFLAGFLNGLAAGYISHLALDAGTPHSIPLLKAGRQGAVLLKIH